MDIVEKEVRSIALLRVSSKAQSGEDNDLPTQRKLVQDYILRSKYKLIKEFVESGVSGYKNLSTERDAIVSILNMAKRKEFDVLVIYHSNRLGRLQDDTPKIIKDLHKYNVKVISVVEGELKADTPINRLMNTIRYFGNEQESSFKSEAISDYHIAMVEEGRFRGGSMIPLGYSLEDKGSKNYKGKHIMDFFINEEEAEIIRLIFKLSIENNYGQSKIAKYLNTETDYKTKKNGNWHSSTIQAILNNTIYKGQHRLTSKIRDKTVFSPIKEELVIIPEEIWETNQKIMKSRIFKNVYDDVRDKRTSKNTYGKMLLNGLVICGHCGMALTTMTVYNRWTTIDGVKHKTGKYKYRCASFYKKGSIECEGQSTYAISKIEPYVEAEAILVAKELQGKTIGKEFLKNIDKQIDELNKKRKVIKDEIEKDYLKLKALNDEYVKSLVGDSPLTKEQVASMINTKQLEIKDNNKKLPELENDINQLKIDKISYSAKSDDLDNFEEKYYSASLEQKRLMLSKIFNKVIVYRDEIHYDIKVDLNIYEENMEDIGCNSEHNVRTNCGILQRINVYKDYKKIKLVI